MGEGVNVTWVRGLCPTPACTQRVKAAPAAELFLGPARSMVSESLGMGSRRLLTCPPVGSHAHSSVWMGL